MIKDKISSAIPPEDVIIRKSKLVETLTDPASDHALQKYKRPVIIISSVLIVFLVVAVAMAIWSMPIRAASVDIDMYAVRMYEDGRLSTEGHVVIRGDRLDYRNESIASEFDAAVFTILGENYKSDNAVYQEDGTIHGLYHSPSGVYFLTFELSSNEDWCVIQTNDRGSIQYFVCSRNADFDPTEIFAKSIFSKN